MTDKPNKEIQENRMFSRKGGANVKFKKKIYIVYMRSIRAARNQGNKMWRLK